MAETAQRHPGNWLVTGGAGFIGSNFVRQVATQPGAPRLVVLDALTYAGNLANIADLVDDDRVVFVHGNINYAELVDSLFKWYDIDCVVNFAAESHVDRSIDNPRPFFETNLLGTQTLLDCARKNWSQADGTWPSDCIFVQISTDEVYGSLHRDYAAPQPVEIDAHTRQLIAGKRDDTPKAYGSGLFTEDTPLAPRSPYSASKAAADMAALAYHHTYGMPVCVTRCSNNYGPRQFPEKLIPLLINNLVNGQTLPVYGEGLNVRDWLYVDDHCAAITKVIGQGQSGTVYNIGGLNEQQNIDIVHRVISLVAEMTGQPVRHDLVRHVRDRAGHDMRYAIDPGRIAEQLHWAPTTAFTDGIRKTVRWYLDNAQWTEQVTSGEYRNYYAHMYNGR